MPNFQLLFMNDNPKERNADHPVMNFFDAHPLMNKLKVCGA